MFSWWWRRKYFVEGDHKTKKCLVEEGESRKQFVVNETKELLVVSLTKRPRDTTRCHVALSCKYASTGTVSDFMALGKFSIQNIGNALIHRGAEIAILTGGKNSRAIKTIHWGQETYIFFQNGGNGQLFLAICF